MKISAFPKGELDDIVFERGITVLDWIETASTLPIEGVELYSRMFLGKGTDFQDAVADSLASHDLVMPMLCASPDFTHPDHEVRKRELDDEIEMVTAARRISGPGVSVRVLSGQAHPGVSREEGLEWAVAAIEELIPVARELDVLLCIENHYKDGFWKYPEFAQKPEVFCAILDHIADDVTFGVQFDPSNAIVAGVDSADFLDRVKGRVYTMQASDRSLAPGTDLESLRQADGTIGYSPALQHGVIGQGLNDYDRIFRTLHDVGYDGWISIEDGVNGFGEMRESCEFLCRVRDECFEGSKGLSVRSLDAARSRAGRQVRLGSEGRVGA